MTTSIPRKTKNIYITGEINDKLANEIQLMLLDIESTAGKPIRLIINSNGGSVYPAHGIIDVMDFVSYPIETECNGIAAGTAALILAMGKRGHRYAHKDSRIVIMYAKSSQPNNVASLDEIHKLNKEIISMLANHMNKTAKEICMAIDRATGELCMTAEEAKEFGIVDEIID